MGDGIGNRRDGHRVDAAGDYPTESMTFDKFTPKPVTGLWRKR